MEELTFFGRRVVLEEGLEGRVTQDHNTKSDASHLDNVGAILWDGSAVLSSWLERNADVVRGKTVLELGAGTGLCSIVAAFAGCSGGWATDMGHIVPLLQRNLKANAVDDRVLAATFQWGVDQTPPTLDADVILAADCVYSPQMVDLFVGTLRAVLVKPSAFAIVTSKIRSKLLMETLVAAYEKQSLNMELLSHDKEEKHVMHRVWK